MIKNYIKKLISKFEKKVIERDDVLKLIMGRQLCFAQKSVCAAHLSDIEFKVYSQWGEDGIIEYLVSKLPIENKFFIEFGVENYNESNTRFLMMNRNWGGVIIDGSEKNIEYVKNRDYFWKYDLHPISSFITKENINDLISNKLLELGIPKDIGILSVDIDGVDYWVLREIKSIEPSIIICEYNSVFNNDYPLTVPYDKDFVRENYHYSNLYWGANLKAFDDLLSKRGYVYIGSNQQNSNAFFVKKELAEKYCNNFIKNIPNFDVSKVRESRDQDGILNLLRGKDRLVEIKELELIKLDTDQVIKIKELI